MKLVRDQSWSQSRCVTKVGHGSTVIRRGIKRWRDAGGDAGTVHGKLRQILCSCRAHITLFFFNRNIETKRDSEGESAREGSCSRRLPKHTHMYACVLMKSTHKPGFFFIM
jgi:hypothetical protein